MTGLLRARPTVTVEYHNTKLVMEIDDKNDVNITIELIELVHQKYLNSTSGLKQVVTQEELDALNKPY